MAKHENMTGHMGSGTLGFTMFLAFIGAFVYFARDAHDFIGFFNAFFEALVWPAIAIYHVLRVLSA